MSVSIILPNQLFEKSPIIVMSDIIYLVEDLTFFVKFKYHKMKLVLHRASMKYYFNFLKKKYNKKKIYYIEYNNIDYDILFSENNIINIYNPIDHDLLKLFKKYEKKYNNKLNIYDNLLFSETLQDLNNYHVEKKNYIQNPFYIWQRKRLNIFMNGDKPLYDRWSFDVENRNKYDKDYIEKKQKINNSSYIKNAKNYIDKHFFNNYGTYDDFIYPINHSQAKTLFKHFLNNDINSFGKYQDSISMKIYFGSHSLLSSSINIGLINIQFIIQQINNKFNKLNNNDKKKYYNNYEGYIRQIIGWRSYIRYIYVYYGKNLINENFFNNNQKLSINIWYDNKKKTNIEIIDFLIKKTLKYAYLHHIERLMLIGNFFLLTNVKPDEVYKWFMTLFIDAYEYIMVANIVMSQYNTESIKIMSKPYFSSANYILKMSDINNKDKVIEINEEKYNWIEIWNILFYNFVNKNKIKLKKIYSTANYVNILNKKSNQEITNITNLFNKYIKNYH